ncbi:ATP-binding cassette transporter [Dendrothele bispora CBS 962.96]|uniref:ATP-binding cassette transporter n=1 Tax=Dendrothele bispora (strain CBS 962.96) TaxID=1314807 RepID=A0A4S8KUP3_DENBC|nr:ATP-binding cassette transporter [Dendrothele bispora CBS 962.96]
MARFQFEIAVLLAIFGTASFSAFLFNKVRAKDGKIQLPTHTEENGAEDLTPDPFDVTTAEDYLEGYPIEEEKFWKRMRWRKTVLFVLFTAILVLQCVRLGFLSIGNEMESKDLAVSVIHICFALYLLVITALSFKQNTVEPHSLTIIHLAILNFVASVTQAVSAILPNTPPIVESVSAPESLPNNLWYATIVSYIVSAILAFATPCGPPLHFPNESIYSAKTVASTTNTDQANVTGISSASPWGYLYFTYTTKVVMLGNVAESLEIGDLPIVPANMRATVNFAKMKKTMQSVKLKFGNWRPQPGSGWQTAYHIAKLNKFVLAAQFLLAAVSACMFYVPAFFMRMLVVYLENDPNREQRGWGWVYAVGLFLSNIFVYMLTSQLWSLSTTTIQVRFRIQLNSILFAKTLVRKDSASSAPPKEKKGDEEENKKDKKEKDVEDDFSSKAQIMTLMTTDVDRVSEFAWHFFTLVDSRIELLMPMMFLYKLLGYSCFFGLAVTCLFLPMNHFAGKVVVGAQDNLMKTRDERISLMNEVLGAIRMLKFMAWERSFEARVLKIREKELKYQKLNYTIETLWNAIWNGSPILVTLVSFWHYTVVRGQDLTPSIAFTSVLFNELKFALNALPETFINLLQSAVSLRRIEKYLHTVEVSPVPPLEQQSQTIAFQSCTVTWPVDRIQSSTQPSAAPSASSTPRQKFVLVDLSLKFPPGELSLICGKLGSGKTLMLLALLGEADVLTGQLFCPRSPPNAIASFKNMDKNEKWVIQGLTAYVPQSAWLRNASIKENILFNLPYDEERYQQTLEACALVTDMEILEDGDESEIGERGVNLSGGQKARVSLARAVYSRASILLLDDVLSAVDAHTAHHLFYECLKGELMKDRTVILVSHHVQLCAPDASYVVALDNGRVLFEGDRDKFQSSGVMRSLVQSTLVDTSDEKEEAVIEDQSVPSESKHSDSSDPSSETNTITLAPVKEKKPARKLIEEEARAVGRVSRDVWTTYVKACGSYGFWLLFVATFTVAAVTPVAENGWLKVWAGSVSEGSGSMGDRSASFYIGVYAAVCGVGLIVTTLRWFVLYRGSIHASHVLYKRLLETVLFANIRFHDTVNRGRVLNRFGKDFEGIDSSLSDNFGRTVLNGLSTATTLITLSVVGGPMFILGAIVIGSIYWSGVYSQTSRDMRRLGKYSVTRSPLYSIYGETIAGVTIIRSFGASSKFLRDMLACVDTNSNPYYWMWGVNRWLSIRFNVLSCSIIGLMAVVAVANPGISASLAGFSLAFASTITGDLLFLVRRFVSLEQSMVALERVKEYSELKREPPEFIEPRPPASWPSKGSIRCEDLVIRYAPDLPNVLHHLNFEILPGEKVGILGRTGSGKSTLALSFFRFVDPTEGRILVDDLDISKIGLTDLRSKLTIIPQDPAILSGTLRSTLDVFDEYQDSEIYEALRRVHLIPSDNIEEEETLNANVFRNLESPVSEGGENFSTGSKQLLCMARAILKRSKVLVMDEATASVDYATDELIGKTIRQEFADNTILTIAHRLRTVIDYDRIMLLDQGRIVEFDRPGVLLSQPTSKFYALCKATGKDEFAMLKKLAGL